MRVKVLCQKITKVPSEVIVAGFFHDVRPLKGLLAEIDWLYNGNLSKLIMEGKISGVRGEVLLMGGWRRLAAPKVLAVGLGKRDDLNYNSLKDLSAQIAERLLKLEVSEVAMDILGVESSPLNYMEAAESIIQGLEMGTKGKDSFEVILLLKDPMKGKELEGRIKGMQDLAIRYNL